MKLDIVPFEIGHYEQVYELWKRSEGIGLSASDSREGIARFLDRNPAMSFVAVEGERVIGVVMCGYDGRRGYITHLAVDAEYRRRGVGRALVSACVEAMRRANIEACNLFILNDNASGRAFWESQGWTRPDYWGVMNRKLLT